MDVTWLFVAMSVTFKIFVDLGIGLAVTGERAHGKRFMRALITILLGLPGIFIVAIWHDTFSSVEFGLANQSFRMVGPDSTTRPSERWMALLAYNVTEA